VQTYDTHTSDDRSRARRWRRYGLRLLLGTSLAALLVAGCGDDDGDDTGDAPASGDAAAGESPDAYCAAALAGETAGEPDIDVETATPEDLAAAAKEFASGTLMPLADDIVAHAPDEISADLDVMVAAIREMTETGDFAAFETPEVTAASERVHAYDLESCGWATVDVVTSDYTFDGFPAEVPAGVTSFELDNEGPEVHEIVLLRKNDGVTESFDELLAMPEDEAEGKATFVGVAGPVPAGEGAYLVADLEPGDYLALCFLPVGTTSLDGGPPPEGPPHFMSGMTQEFTVA
jgi:hypothetical protein